MSDCKNIGECLICRELFCANCTESERDDCCSAACEMQANFNDAANAKDDAREDKENFEDIFG